MVDPENETPPEETQEEKAPEGEAEEKPEGEAQAEEADAEAKPEAEEEPAETKPEEEGKEEQQEGTRKRAGGWQRKIERLERERQVLMEQLARQAPPTASTKPAAEQTPEEKAREYVRSLVREEREAAERQAREQSVVADFQRRTAEVRAKHDDFDDVVAAADIPVGSPLGQALLTSEHGPAIMYQLASNPAELARLTRLPPLDAAREVGRLEAKLTSVAPSPVKPKSALRPPAPPTSVNGRSSSTRSLDDLPLRDYKLAMRSRR